MKKTALTGFCIFLLLELCAQEETAQYVFNWTESPSPATSPAQSYASTSSNPSIFFWETGINCRSITEPGGSTRAKSSRVQFRNTTHTRFDKSYSLEFYTDAGIAEHCNQNATAVRAELIAEEGSSYLLSPGSLFPAQTGSTLWMGWSELYTDFDYGHRSTLVQFLQEEFANPVSSSINYHPEKGIYVGVGGTYHTLLNRSELQENTWYDWIVEFKYSFHETGPEAGSIRIWIYPADDPNAYAYSDPPTLSYMGATLPKRPSANIKPLRPASDSLHLWVKPQIRMGIYRWESGMKSPVEIIAEDRRFIKYLGTTRMEIGSNLKEQGFEAVKPRVPLSSESSSFSRASQQVIDSLSKTHLFLHPNPLSSHSTLRIRHSQEERGELRIWDMTGRMLRQHPIEVQAGISEIPIKKGKLAAGSYTLQVSFGEKISTLRFVIE